MLMGVIPRPEPAQIGNLRCTVIFLVESGKCGGAKTKHSLHTTLCDLKVFNCITPDSFSSKV